MKILAGIVLVFCCGMVGMELYIRQARVRDLVGDMLDFCLHMSTCVRYQQTLPNAILLSFNETNNSVLSLCKNNIQNAQNFNQAWSNMLTHPLFRLLTGEEFNLIKQLGCGFGYTDCAGETARLEHIYERLDMLYQRRQDSCSRQGKSYLTVGFLTGMIIMIFMI